MVIYGIILLEYFSMSAICKCDHSVEAARRKGIVGLLHELLQVVALLNGQ